MQKSQYLPRLQATKSHNTVYQHNTCPYCRQKECVPWLMTLTYLLKERQVGESSVGGGGGGVTVVSMVYHGTRWVSVLCRRQTCARYMLCIHPPLNGRATGRSGLDRFSWGLLRRQRLPGGTMAHTTWCYHIPVERLTMRSVAHLYGILALTYWAAAVVGRYLKHPKLQHDLICPIDL